MSDGAQNIPLENAEMVSVPKIKWDRMVSQYKMMVAEKVQMERDISVLMFVGRKLMSLFQGGNILKTAMGIMKNPDKHKAEFAHLEQLYITYQHLMPVDPGQQAQLHAADDQ